MSKMQVPFKSLKVSFTIHPDDLPRRDTTGLKSMEMVFQIPETTIRLTAQINPKTYRRVIKCLDENPGNVVLAIQGTINDQWQVLKDAGLIAQVKVSKETPPFADPLATKPIADVEHRSVQKLESKK
jgi:Cys-tRNA synthase (O-phospho-L-seryl-tRNA:Cys-tRNA synthase)